MIEESKDEEAPPPPDLHGAVIARYPTSSYATFFEVADGTGGNRSRAADAVVVGLWPSRGLEIEGIEFKVSRGDWQRELKQPEKAEAIAKYCDRWWIVAPPGVVVVDELPGTWGLIEVKVGIESRIKKQAPKLEPRPIDRTFFAALSRAAAKPDAKRRQREIQQAHADGVKQGKSRAAAELEHAEKNLTLLQQKVDAFEKAAGFRIQSWGKSPHDIGQIVKDVLLGRYNREEAELRRLRDTALEIAAAVEKQFPAQVSQ